MVEGVGNRRGKGVRMGGEVVGVDGGWWRMGMRVVRMEVEVKGGGGGKWKGREGRK